MAPAFEALDYPFAIKGRQGVVYSVKNPGGYPEPGVLRGQVVKIDDEAFEVLGVESFMIARPYPDHLDFALQVIPATKCPECGSSFVRQRKWNGGNPKDFWLPTCECEEKAMEADLDRRWGPVPRM